MVRLPRSYQYRPAVLPERRGGLLLRGMAIVASHWRSLTWLWFFNFALAGLATIAFSAQAHSVLDNSFAADQLQNGLNLGGVASFVMKTNKVPSGSLPAAIALDFVYFLIAFIFTPGILACYLGDEITSLGNMLRSGLRYFWRFVRFSLVAGIIAAIILGGLGFLRIALLKGLNAHAVTKANFWIGVVTLACILAVAFLLRLWFDFAELCIVDRGAFRLGRSEDRRAVRTLAPGFRLLRLGVVRLYLSFVLAGALGWFALLLCLKVWHALPPYAPFRGFLLAQFGMLCMLAARLWQRGMQVAWFERAGEFITPVAEPLTAPPIETTPVVVAPVIEPEPVVRPDDPEPLPA